MFYIHNCPRQLCLGVLPCEYVAKLMFFIIVELFEHIIFQMFWICVGRATLYIKPCEQSFYIIFELFEHIIFQLFGVCVGMETGPNQLPGTIEKQCKTNVKLMWLLDGVRDSGL